MQDQKNKKIIILSLVIFLATAFLIGTKLVMDKKDKEFGFLATKEAESFVRDYSPRQGKKDAKVVLVEFLDPECESCRAFYPYVKKILADNPEKVQLVVRYMPFHKNSKYAIKVLEAAREQDLYWQTMAILFYFQPQWGDHHNPKPERIFPILKQIAENPESKFNIDLEKLKKDMENPKILEYIDQDMKDGKKLKVKATPTFFVNGKPLTKFGYQNLVNLINEEIKVQYP